MQTEDKLRLFVGVKVSMATVRALSGSVEAARREAPEAGPVIRWVAPATYHVTLKFIGWTRSESVGAIRDRVGAALARMRGFSFTTRGAGAFPDPAKARVVWAGVDDAGGDLARAAEAVESALVGLGYPKEKRPFHPHVTVGRLREVASVEELLLPWTEQSFSETRVGSIVLFNSSLKSSGSEYSEVAEWPLELSSKSSKRQTGGLEPTLTDDQTPTSGAPGEESNGPEQRH